VNFGNGATSLGAGTVAVTGSAQGFSNMTFAAGSGAILLSGGTLNLAQASTITVNNPTDSISTDLQGSSKLIKAGTGTLTLSGANTFSGGLSVSAGKLWLCDNTMSLGSGTISVNGGNTMSLTNVSLTTAGPVSIGSSSSEYSLGSANNTVTVYSNTVWNASGVTIEIGYNGKNGNVLNIAGGTLTNAGIYVRYTANGQFNVSSGNVYLTSSLYVNSADARANITGGNLVINSIQHGIQVAGQVLISAGNVSITAGGNVFNNGTGSITQSGGSVTVNGGQVFSQTWANAPAYYISGGTFTVTGSNPSIRGMNIFKASGSAVVNFGASSGTYSLGALGLSPVITVQDNASVTFAKEPLLKDNTVGVATLNLNGGVFQVPGFTAPSGTNTINFNGGTLAFSAKTTINSSALSTFNVKNGGAVVDTGANVVTNKQALINAGSGGLTKLGSSALTLGGANTYIGPTMVSAGSLRAGVASVADVSGAFGLNSAVTLTNVAGVTLDITGYNTQIGSLTGGGATGGNVTLGAATLTVGGDDTSPAAYAGVISGSGSQTTSLLKIGAGALLLDGMNTYTGATTVTSGTLGGIGKIAGTTTVASNAFVSGGSTTAVGTLTVTNLVMKEGAGLAWNYGTTTQDSVVVAGALTLATNAVVNVSAAEGAALSQLPPSAVLMTYTSSSGATSLNGWVVNGLLSARVKLDAPNKQVLLLKSRGTIISVM
jgi:autotransporter-associated beta strand protein